MPQHDRRLSPETLRPVVARAWPAAFLTLVALVFTPVGSLLWRLQSGDADAATPTSSALAVTPPSASASAVTVLPSSAARATAAHPRRHAKRAHVARKLGGGVFGHGLLLGPYAPSVLDGLAEMELAGALKARGLWRPDAGLAEMLRSIPSRAPALGYISSGFGIRQSPFTGETVRHLGVDFAVPQGAPVRATADGVVVYAGTFFELGRLVAIDHGNGLETRYGHNERLLVAVGTHVQRGDLIARAGSTGRSTGPHVHYEVWVRGHPVNPAAYLEDVPRTAVSGLTLGAVGGELGAPARRHLAPWRPRAAIGPSPEAQLPLNLAILGVFAVLALALCIAAWPRRIRMLGY